MIDPTTDVGKLRLKVGDINDLQLLPDAVYTQTLADNQNNINRSAQTIAGYIAALLSQRTHQKLSFIEIWGTEAFKNYIQFLDKVILNPNMAGVSPLPYGSGTDTTNPITQFQQNWPKGYAGLTEDEQLAILAQSAVGIYSVTYPL